MKQLVLGLICAVAFTDLVGCSSSGGGLAGTATLSASTGALTSGGSGGGSTGAATPSPIAVIQPSPGQSFSSASLAAGGGEAELFYAESQGAGTYAFELQHLSASGSPLGSPIEVATGSPQNPPATSVSSDGLEIACCWEDYATDPNPYGGGGPPGSPPLPVVLCNSVPVGGGETDLAMDGGFIVTGSTPITATNAGSTILIFRQPVFGLEQELLYRQWGYNNDFGPSYMVKACSVAPVPGGFDVFTSDGGQLDDTGDGLQIQFGATTPVPVVGAGVGTLATASSGDTVGLLIHDGSSIASTVLSDAGTVSTEIVLSSAGETLAQAVAAATCAGGEFGFAYALTGGAVMFREVGANGAPVGAASTLVANLGVTATGLALAQGDGGLLLAVGTADKIGVFGIGCP